MAEQGRYDRDYARGSYYEDDDRGTGRDRGREGGQSRRSDSLFGSGWDEREERGWGSSGGRDQSGDSKRSRGGSSWFDGSDRSDRGSTGSSSRDRGEGGRSGGSWFGGSGGGNRERDHLGRDREWEPVEVRSRDEGSERRGREERERLERERLERDRTSNERQGRERIERERGDRDRSGRESGERERMEREREDRGRSDRDRNRDDRSGRGGAMARDGYGPDDPRDGLPMDETGRLIASNKVEGTAVYGLDGERLGSVYNFMVEKVAGKVEYAVMTYGGFLGMGTRYYPIPWQMLKFDTRRGGYRVDLTSRDLERAPSFDRSNEPKFDREYGQRVHSWYGLNY